MALIIVVDQFPRSLYRDTARAFGGDPISLTLVLEGFANGHCAALESPWQKVFHHVVIGHAEGPGHVERLEADLPRVERLVAEAPAHLRDMHRFNRLQTDEALRVIRTFGRHPHRNAALGRESTPKEAAYVAEGRSPTTSPASSSRRRSPRPPPRPPATGAPERAHGA